LSAHRFISVLIDFALLTPAAVQPLLQVSDASLQLSDLFLSGLFALSRPIVLLSPVADLGTQRRSPFPAGTLVARGNISFTHPHKLSLKQKNGRRFRLRRMFTTAVAYLLLIARTTILIDILRKIVLLCFFVLLGYRKHIIRSQDFTVLIGSFLNRSSKNGS
jgi:hypothetical protein